jgi:ribosome-binding protein aMBF1 (putative translation factor)
LGFAQRKIHALRTDIPVQRRGRKPFPTTLKSFGDRLRTKRLEMGLTQPELAENLVFQSFNSACGNVAEGSRLTASAKR